MKEMKCIPSCTYNKYIVREWYDSNFDMLAYQFGDDQRDGANFEVSIILFLLFRYIYTFCGCCK